MGLGKSELVTFDICNGSICEFLEGFFFPAKDCVATRELAIPIKLRKKILRSFIVALLWIKNKKLNLKLFQFES
jgi:hypothetical protein